MISYISSSIIKSLSNKKNKNMTFSISHLLGLTLSLRQSAIHLILLVLSIHQSGSYFSYTDLYDQGYTYLRPSFKVKC